MNICVHVFLAVSSIFFYYFTFSNFTYFLYSTDCFLSIFLFYFKLRVAGTGQSERSPNGINTENQTKSFNKMTQKL